MLTVVRAQKTPALAFNIKRTLVHIVTDYRALKHWEGGVTLQ